MMIDKLPKKESCNIWLSLLEITLKNKKKSKKNPDKMSLKEIYQIAQNSNSSYLLHFF